MKRFSYFIIAVSFLFVTVFACRGVYKTTVSLNRAAEALVHTVVIDAGHGGKDAGTIGVDGTEEKGINLEISLTLRDYLMVSGIKAVMTREDDTELYPEGSDKNRSDLYNRLDYINAIPNSILISIHQNHFSEEKEWGSQIWYSANTPQSKALADSILENVKGLLQPENKRVNKVSDSSYYLLYQASVPSIMIECGFMSNRDENERLKNSNYQKKYAFAILTGICGEV